MALAVAFITAPLIAWATDGKYYIARKPKRSWQNLEAIQCCICEHSFEPEDMASCPAYAGPICSLCCSLDARCHDLCKPHARIGAQVSETLGKMLPETIYARINSQFGHYLGVFAVSAGLVGLTLGLIYLQTSATIAVDNLRCPTCSGRCSSRSPSSSAWWRGCSCWRNRADARRKRKRGGRPRC